MVLGHPTHLAGCALDQHARLARSLVQFDVARIHLLNIEDVVDEPDKAVAAWPFSDSDPSSPLASSPRIHG